MALTLNATRCQAGFSAVLPAKVRSVKFIGFRNAVKNGTAQRRIAAFLQYHGICGIVGIIQNQSIMLLTNHLLLNRFRLINHL